MSELYTSVGLLSDPQTIILDEPVTIPTGRVRVTLEILPIHSFWTEMTVEELAKIQGVKPIKTLDDLWGDFWPEDESIDDFIETVRQWRQESIDD